jgi:uncharacterized membrane protein YgaE (UPF0421/DUF939 family)
MNSTKNRTIKYKTFEECYKPFAIGVLVFLFVYIAVMINWSIVHEVHEYSGLPAFIIAICLDILFICYCYSGDYKRKKYKAKGARFEGTILSAKESFNGRGNNRYYLKISFSDKGQRTMVTKAYAGNPNMRLRSRKCSVYGYNGKYIEDDFETLLKKEEPKSLGIPITRK